MASIANISRSMLLTAAIGSCAVTLVGCGDGNAQEMRMHGPNNAITDVDGIRVGQYQQIGGGYQTGTTVVWAPESAVGSAYVGGGWPGTINTDVLQPGKRGQKIDAAFLTGGSYFGLQAFGGIMQWLEENRYGMVMGPSPEQVDPLVSGAVVYDLGRAGSWTSRPVANFGYEAIKAAKTGPVAQGNVGAGTGTGSNGGLPLKGGLGTASEVQGNVTVGVVLAVNAAGTPVDLDTCALRGTSVNLDGEFAKYTPPTPSECAALKAARNIKISEASAAAAAAAAEANNTPNGPWEVHPNTTISIVATNATLTIEQAHTLAQAVNDGLGTVIKPFNQRGDGDAVFTMSTGKVTITDEQFNKLLASAKDTAGRAVAHAMLNATSIGKQQSYCDALPASCKP